MILLRHDCLVFKTGGGESIPCSAEQVTVELLGEAAGEIDPEVIRNAAHAVLHYFKHDLGQVSVSVPEFSRALEHVLRELGFRVVAPQAAAEPVPPERVAEADLGALTADGGAGLELQLFPRLRAELRQQLSKGPRIVRFRGLRGTVKRLLGARRWNPRCQRLNDQIVDFLRTCLSAETRGTAEPVLLLL